MTGVALNHRIDGPVDAPALVLGSSLGATMSIWDRLIPELARELRVVRYDHRGHGGSPAPPGPYSIAELAADVLALLDRLGITRASYAGVSLGGMVGMWLGVHAPDRVSHLALVCTSAFFGLPDAWRARAAAVRAQGMEAVAHAVLARWFTPSFVKQQPDDVAKVADVFRSVDREGYASCCEAIAPWDFRPFLGQIRAPTLVVAGAQDTATPPSHAYRIGAGVPGARVIVVEGAAHLVVLERPEVMGPLLVEHVTGRAAGGAAEPKSDRDRSQAGEGVRRAVLGDAHVDAARAAATPFSEPFQDMVNRFPWGEIWTRPGLSRAERSIVTLSVLAALRHDEELGMHVAAAIRNGLTAEQVREILLHVGAYAGIPVANRAIAVASRVLEPGAGSPGEEKGKGT